MCRFVDLLLVAFCCLLVVARNVLFVVFCLVVDLLLVFSWLLFGVGYEFVVL